MGLTVAIAVLVMAILLNFYPDIYRFFVWLSKIKGSLLILPLIIVTTAITVYSTAFQSVLIYCNIFLLKGLVSLKQVLTLKYASIILLYLIALIPLTIYKIYNNYNPLKPFKAGWFVTMMIWLSASLLFLLNEYSIGISY